LKLILAEDFFYKKKTNVREKGHIVWFRETIDENKGWPEHDMKELPVTELTLKLDPYIGSKPTLKLRQLLYHANDKIKMINNFKNRVGFNDVSRARMHKLLLDFEFFLDELRNEIEGVFRIKLSKQEINTLRIN